jgi:arginine repressor
VLAKPDHRVLNALATLRGSQDFIVVTDWIRQSLSDLDVQTRHTKDEILVRWHQGAAQVLEDLLDRAESAGDVIRKSR